MLLFDVVNAAKGHELQVPVVSDLLLYKKYSQFFDQGYLVMLCSVHWHDLVNMIMIIIMMLVKVVDTRLKDSLFRYAILDKARRELYSCSMLI